MRDCLFDSIRKIKGYIWGHKGEIIVIRMIQTADVHGGGEGSGSCAGEY